MVTYAEMVEEHRRAMERQRESIARLSADTQPRYTNQPFQSHAQRRRGNRPSDHLRRDGCLENVPSRSWHYWRRSDDLRWARDGLLKPCRPAMARRRRKCCIFIFGISRGRLPGRGVFSGRNAIMALLAGLVVREAREDFGANEDD